jgi:hypothetical protein
MEAKIVLVSGPAILPSSFTDLASASSLMNSSMALLKARVLITCLITNLFNELLITTGF